MEDKENDSEQEEHGVNSGVNSLPGMAGKRIVSYNLSEDKRPGGIKVRYKIRIVTGQRAREVDARQAQVIREVLEWSRQHRQHPAP